MRRRFVFQFPRLRLADLPSKVKRCLCVLVFSALARIGFTSWPTADGERLRHGKSGADAGLFGTK